MICHFALIIALLCLELSRGALINRVKSISETAAGHNPLVETLNVDHVELMSDEASQKIHDSYMKSQKRLILLDNDGTIKPMMSKNSAHDQERITRALQKLSEDPKNEVWIITASHVKKLEQAYGDFPKLHLAGYMGTQLDRESALGIVLPKPGPITKLRDEADRIAAALGISPKPLSQNNYFIDYSVPLKTSEGESNQQKVLEMEDRLEKMIQSNKEYKRYNVKVIQTPKNFRVELEDRDHYNKGTLAEELLRKHEQDNGRFDFGLSIGDMEMDEPMHKAMKERHYHTLVVRGNDGNTYYPWPTYASHRLEDYRKSIDLLEKLAGTRNWKNDLKHRVLQSLRGIRQKIKLLFDKLGARFSRLLAPLRNRAS